VQAGHRELVLLLAQVYPRPAVDAGNKTGMWSTSRSIVAYYSDEVLSLNSPRDFKAMPGAKKNRFRVGLSEDPARSKLGAHTIRRAFCACSSCFAPKFDFGNCRFQNLVGRSQRGWCPPAKPVGGALPAVMEVAEFAGTLKAGDFRAVNVARETRKTPLSGSAFSSRKTSSRLLIRFLSPMKRLTKSSTSSKSSFSSSTTTSTTKANSAAIGQAMTSA